MEKELKAEIPLEGPVPVAAALAEVTVFVCTTCRDETGSDAHPRPGAVLAAATRDAAGSRVRVCEVECLGNCKRRLSAAVMRDGCWSYVFGDLGIEDGADLVAAAMLYAGSDGSVMPWRGRPDKLKRGLVSRIPPLAALKDIA